MIPIFSLVLGGSPATASIPGDGLEPVFWTVVALIVVAAARVALSAWSSARALPPTGKGTPRLSLVRPLPRGPEPSWSDAV